MLSVILIQSHIRKIVLITTILSSYIYIGLQGFNLIDNSETFQESQSEIAIFSGKQKKRGLKQNS